MNPVDISLNEEIVVGNFITPLEFNSFSLLKKKSSGSDSRLCPSDSKKQATSFKGSSSVGYGILDKSHP
jgi:hypothetical protein